MKAKDNKNDQPGRQEYKEGKNAEFRKI